MASSHIHFLLLLLPLFFFLPNLTHTLPTPRNCSDPFRICASYIAIKSVENLSLPLIQSMFDVFPSDITVDDHTNPHYFFVRKNCSCSPSTTNNFSSSRKNVTSFSYLTNTTFTVRDSYRDVVPAYDAVVEAYGPLAVFANSSRTARNGSVVSLRLMCGCSSGLWNYLVSYAVEDGDSVELLSSRFGVSMDSIETVNGLSGDSVLGVGDACYIPLDSVPGEPYILKREVPPAPAPTLEPPSYPVLVTVNQEHHVSRISIGWIVGGIGAAFFLVALLILVCFCFNYFCCDQESRSLSKDPNVHASHHKFQILRRSSFCYTAGSHLCFKFGKQRPVTSDVIDHQIDIPKGMMTDAFDIEKPVVFSYEEIVSSTDGFSDANLLGHGSYGSVYYGVLRDQEVAIKRMTATKNKEFMAEMKVLCRVHHASLVELIGYAASGNELFVIYEYAQKGSLKNHLHDPQNKGHTSLSWIARVQIAVDAAKGLEYIHEHTRTHYVHRDIKTSNILLDSAFRAKISDFGLTKLISKTNDIEISATKVVGTFGYLAPEYLHDGMATTKSDVYAFGVVLFELISGKEAATRSDGMVLTNVERRSLASIMLGALKNCPSSTNMARLKECIDPNMMNLYPHDCVYKMAVLAKQCVDEDPILRPDMRQVVISLSHILLSSVEWEATLAGNSQVFSGLVQGR